jgi:hypothetical protein
MRGEGSALKERYLEEIEKTGIDFPATNSKKAYALR